MSLKEPFIESIKFKVKKERIPIKLLKLLVNPKILMMERDLKIFFLLA